MEVKHFASVCEAVCSLIEQGYHTVLEDAGAAKVRLMMRDGGDIMVVRYVGLLSATVEQDDGFWADKLEDWASDAPDYL